VPNRLATETSPYLLQHANNPVEWLPWGDEAFARARAEDKPILLSIGYAACHWCHVMAHESFEDPVTAEIMNALFVNVKVDREERPDVDAIYMQAVQALTGHGGWPMTMFLTPDGAPFYGGTYFPPEPRHGIPAFKRVLASVAEAWRSSRDDVMRGAKSMLEIYEPASRPAEAGTSVDADLLDAAERAVLSRYDERNGGFGGAPKFPPSMTLDFLLRRSGRAENPALLGVVRHTWLRMVQGGLFDQVGGGIHRYAVDDVWLVPHFEKMLYDNALLVRLGAHLWQATGDQSVREATELTLAWIEREMTAPQGGFYASLDADSEGHEGKFYVWSLEELKAALGADSEVLTRFWSATAGGNFEGRNILWAAHTVDEFAEEQRLDPDALRRMIDRARATLLATREQRVRPTRDDKIIAGWNGLMLRGVAECARIFGDSRWTSLARRAGDFLATSMVRDGRALRVFAQGEARIGGFLEDHAALGLGFLALYELTFEPRWLALARELSAACDAQFWDTELGAYFDTATDAPPLVTRPRDINDNAIPAGNSLAVELGQRLAALDGNAEQARRAAAVLASLGELMAKHPLAFGHLLGAAEFEVHGAVSVAIAGVPGDEGFTRLARTVAERYVPSLVLAGGEGNSPALLAGKHPTQGRAQAFVCRGFSCDSPTTEPAELAEELTVAVRFST
jgi:uncharacterized protein YyaL (SSP411 family)